MNEKNYTALLYDLKDNNIDISDINKICKKMNNNDILENIKKNLANNNIGISSNKDIKLSDIHKTKMKSSEKIKIKKHK